MNVITIGKSGGGGDSDLMSFVPGQLCFVNAINVSKV